MMQSTVVIPGYEDARKKSEKAILDAEHFKAAVASPPGKDFVNEHSMVNLRQWVEVGMGKTDDDFFHLTCHIDPSLISKIERGEFVDLEKLLLKDKVSFGRDETRMEWIYKEGETYLVPVIDKNSKISGIRKWEQAFCMYATIYCGTHPDRSKEVWQYIHVINTAAAAYIWENVYSYDITFRHLMAFNPSRSWAVTYNQMWNLCMKEPVHKMNNSFNRFSPSYFTSPINVHANQNSGKKCKSNYCWSYNKGLKCKFGKKCKFIERCSFCDASNHGLYNCPKVERKSSSTVTQVMSASPAAGEK